MKDKIDNAIFKEWCDQLVACQSDGGLKDTLPAIVSKLRDERLVNSELRTMLAEVRREYYFMVAFVVGNIPLLYTDAEGNQYQVEETVVKTTLHIEYASMTASQGADVYHFNEKQREQMHTLLSSDFDELWEALVE